MDPVQKAIVDSLSKYRDDVLTDVLKLLRYIDLHFRITSHVDYYAQLGFIPGTLDLRTIDMPTIDTKINQITISDISSDKRAQLTLAGNKIKEYIQKRNEEGVLPDNIENTEESRFDFIYPIVYNRWQECIDAIGEDGKDVPINGLSKILETQLPQKIGGFPVTASDRTLIKRIELHFISQLRLQQQQQQQLQQQLLLQQPELQRQRQRRHHQLSHTPPRVMQNREPGRGTNIGGKRTTRRRPRRKSTKRLRRRRTLRK